MDSCRTAEGCGHLKVWGTVDSALSVSPQNVVAQKVLTRNLSSLLSNQRHWGSLPTPESALVQPEGLVESSFGACGEVWKRCEGGSSLVECRKEFKPKSCVEWQAASKFVTTVNGTIYLYRNGGIHTYTRTQVPAESIIHAQLVYVPVRNRGKGKGKPEKGLENTTKQKAKTTKTHRKVDK